MIEKTLVFSGKLCYNTKMTVNMGDIKEIFGPAAGAGGDIHR